ncbi:MAG: FecR domain-containing protein [Steroidobacteraceae bacterium]
MGKDSQAEPLQAAARWYARLGAPDCSAEEQAEFERWLSSDARHENAFASVKRAAESLTHMAPDPRLAALADAALREGDGSVSVDRISRARSRSEQTKRAQTNPLETNRKWVRVPLALAASVLVAIGVIRLVPELEIRNTPSVAYEAAPDKARVVRLSDGSTVQLDLASKIEVQMYRDERRITLTAGRAYFKVAHDTSRPFAVTAHGVRTVALGTEFQVDQDQNLVTVTLAEGSVLVSDANGTVPSWEEKLLPGDQVRMKDGAGAPERHTVNPAHVISWMQGRHVFDHTPLAEAVAEINRYSDRKLRLGDPSLADLQIGGNFVAGNGALIASSIAAALPISVVEAGPKEIILFRRHDQALH